MTVLVHLPGPLSGSHDAWSSHVSRSNHLPALTLVFYARTTSWLKNKGQQHIQNTFRVCPQVLSPGEPRGAQERGGPSSSLALSVTCSV